MGRRGWMVSLIWLWGAAVVCAPGGVAWGQRAELNESQRIRLETADDGSRTVDEAAFYALLENAAAWPDEVGAAGAVVPDYGAVSERPAEWRGRVCLIEGRLEVALPKTELARSGWEDVRGLVIRTEAEGSGGDLDGDGGGDGDGAKGRPIVLYVTDPPELESTWYSDEMLKQRGWRVRAVGRFYKVVNWETRGGARSAYPVFVGKGLSRFGPGGGDGGGAGGEGMSPGSVIVFALVMVLASGYLVYRVVALRKRYSGRGRLADYKREREAARVKAEAEKADAAGEGEGLPEDPAAAMEELARRHGEGVEPVDLDDGAGRRGERDGEGESDGKDERVI